MLTDLTRVVPKPAPLCHNWYRVEGRGKALRHF